MQSDLHLAELVRRDRLLRAVGDGSARLLAADALQDELPKVLCAIAEVVRIDRLLVVQETRSHEQIVSHRTCYAWVGPRSRPVDFANDVPAEVAEAPALREWFKPVYEGRAVTASRGTAIPAVRDLLIATGAMSLLLVPIMVRGRHWGQIGIEDCCGEREWSEDEITALQMFAGVVGGAITRERSLEELRRRDLLLQALSRGIAEVLTADVIKDVLPRVFESIGKVAHIDRVLITEGFRTSSIKPRPYYSWTRSGVAERTNLYRVADTSPHSHALGEWVLPLGDGKTAFASLRTSGLEMRLLLESVGLVSLLLVPIMVRGKIWGSVSFDDCGSEYDWTPDEIGSLRLFADLIGAAITRERAAEQLRDRDELLHAVTLSAGEIVTAPYLHGAISNSLEKVARAVRADRMLVLEVVPAASGAPQLLHRNSWHAPEVPLELEAALLAASGPGSAEYLAWTRPLQQGEAIRGTVSRADGVLKEHFERRGLQSTLVVPIMVDGRYWGQISFDACSVEREWTSADTDILKTLAELIGTAIKRERYIEELGNANTIVQNSPTILYRLRGEPAFPMIYVSQNVALLGYDAAGLLDSPTVYQSYVHPEDRSRVQAAMVMLLRRDAAAATIEYRMLTSSGASRWVENRYTPVRDTNGRLVEIEGIMIDITERKAAEEKIARLARTDTLTGLANRSTFTDRLKQAFAGARRGASAFAVLYLDLDRFKEINDTLGHQVGDRLLQEVAERLRKITRDTDVVARLGGDEFAVLQADATDAATSGVLATKIVTALSKPYSIDGNELRVGVSIGVSLCGADNMVATADELLAQADQALYRAKEEGRGQYRFHSAELDLLTRERVALAEELRLGLERNELELYYQPQVELSTGRVTAMEALVRWNHPIRGLLLPAAFLSIAEKSGLMRSLGRWVLNGACRQLRAWRDAGVTVPLVAVNVGFAQVRSGREFVKDVRDSLARYRLQPPDLEIDVTELVLARATLAQSGVLEELHKLGVHIAIDDFGTEYSSLDYLRTYQVSRLKISRPFVQAASSDQAGAALVRAIMSLAAELGVEVVAEGVETQAQRHQLVRLGAGARAEGQGFLFSAPVPAAQTFPVLQEGALGCEWAVRPDATL